MGVSRCPVFEAGFVDQACCEAGVARLGFQRTVADRLDQGQRAFGDRALHTPLAELARELGEEAADLATWSVLAAQSDDIADMDLDRRLRIMQVLQHVAAEGARAAHHVAQLADLLDE